MNVQQTIIKGIKEQLYFHNYLVLPGFGGFVLKPVPAHITSSGGLLVPPGKTVSFNAQLKQNDGVLAVWLETKLKCNAVQAGEHLKDFAEFCSGILEVKRRLSLDGIGFLYLDFENNICFEPQQDANFLTDSFGLGAVSIRALEIEKPLEKAEPVFVDRTVEHIEKPVIKPLKRRYRQLVYPALFSIVFVSLLGLLVSNIKIKGELKSSLFEGKYSRNYEPLSYSTLQLIGTDKKTNTYVADANGIATLRVDENKILSVKVLGETSLIETKNTTTKNHSNFSGKSRPFEIVVGCFAVELNANKMVTKLSRRNIKAYISGQNAKGMYVVSNGSFSSKEEALSKLMEIKDAYPNAWIKKD